MESLRIRNLVSYCLATGFLVLAILSWPTEQFDISSPPVTSFFFIGFATAVQWSNGTTGSLHIFLSGVVTLTGKGGISAQNPLDMKVTLYVNETNYGGEPSQITLTPLGAYPPSVGYTPEGNPIQAALVLGRVVNNKWYGEGTVVYNQEGVYYMQVNIGNASYISSSAIHIGPETITVAARTNSLLVSLTWAILLFAALELRVEDHGGYYKREQQHDDHLQGQHQRTVSRPA